MNAGRAHHTPALTVSAELRRSIEHALARTSWGGSRVDGIRRRGFAGSTSYAVEILTVELATGETVEIFMKDFGRSRLPKDAPAGQRERELGVYQHLLADQDLGTARYYGARWDEPAARFWLMLEFVDGELLRDCGFRHWLAAAGWLGRLHGRFARQRDRVEGCAFLVRHDTDFFVHAAERAVRALSSLSDALAHRLGAVLDGYEPILGILGRDAETLVHGSYRPQNVLVVRSPEPARICPTDWELAAFGRSAYDLAYICHGFPSRELDALLDAYGRGLASSGLQARPRSELRHEVDCFRLHKTISSLGHLRQWTRPEATAAKVVAAAEALAGGLA